MFNFQYFNEYKLGGSPTYAKNFLAWIGICSQIPNLLMSLFNMFVQIGCVSVRRGMQIYANYSGKLTVRIATCLGINILLCALTLILIFPDSSTCTLWQSSKKVNLIFRATRILLHHNDHNCAVEWIEWNLSKFNFRRCCRFSVDLQ